MELISGKSLVDAIEELGAASREKKLQRVSQYSDYQMKAGYNPKTDEINIRNIDADSRTPREENSRLYIEYLEKGIK